MAGLITYILQSQFAKPFLSVGKNNSIASLSHHTCVNPIPGDIQTLLTWDQTGIFNLSLFTNSLKVNDRFIFNGVYIQNRRRRSETRAGAKIRTNTDNNNIAIDIGLRFDQRQFALNYRSSGNWGGEVWLSWPTFTSGEKFEIVAEIKETEWVLYFNGDEMDKRFPHRTPSYLDAVELYIVSAGTLKNGTLTRRGKIIIK